MRVLTLHATLGHASIKVQESGARTFGLDVMRMNILGGYDACKRFREEKDWTNEDLRVEANKRSSESAAKGGAQNSQTLF